MSRPKGLPKTGGREKGTLNRTTGDVKAMILAALDKAGGAEYLLQQAKANPGPFLALIGKVLPKDVLIDHNVSVTVTRERIVDATQGLLAALTKVRGSTEPPTIEH